MPTDLPNFDKHWNYGDPAGTEQKFREILTETANSDDFEYKAQLLTQIGRCQALQGQFEAASATLDEADKLILINKLQLAEVRYLLERGRTFNSSGQPETAMPLFQKAYELGLAQNQVRYAIDAVHMIAIAEPDPKDQIRWNLKGIELCDEYPDQKAWLHALLNNIGESYLLAKDYAKAYESFHRLSGIQKEYRGEADMYTLKDEAKALRLGGQPEKALDIAKPILDKLLLEKQDDGHIRLEVAEALFALGKPEDAKPHFQSACKHLSEDDWFAKSDPQQPARMEELSK